LINQSNSHGRHDDLPEAKAKLNTAIGQERFLRSAATSFVSKNLKLPNRVALFCLRGLASSPEAMMHT
jgi:hypothetical protein